MAEDIEHWKRQREKLLEDLGDFLSGVRHEHDLSTPGKRIDVTPQRIAELEKQIAALDRHIAALEKRRNA